MTAPMHLKSVVQTLYRSRSTKELVLLLASAIKEWAVNVREGACSLRALGAFFLDSIDPELQG